MTCTGCGQALRCPVLNTAAFKSNKITKYAQLTMLEIKQWLKQCLHENGSSMAEAMRQPTNLIWTLCSLTYCWLPGLRLMYVYTHLTFGEQIESASILQLRILSLLVRGSTFFLEHER